MTNKKGFTLIEIIIALAVFLIGIVGVIAVIPMGQNSSKEAAVVTQAAMVASEKMSEVKAYGYNSIAQVPPPFPLTGTKDGIAWEVQISDVLASDFSQMVSLPVQDLKKVIVTITYQLKRKTRQDTFHTFVAQF